MMGYADVRSAIDKMADFRYETRSWKDLDGKYDDEKVKNLISSAIGHCMAILKDLEQSNISEVTFCKDCKNYHETAVEWCMYHDAPVKSRSFCSWGRRKDEQDR